MTQELLPRVKCRTRRQRQRVTRTHGEKASERRLLTQKKGRSFLIHPLQQARPTQDAATHRRFGKKNTHRSRKPRACLVFLLLYLFISKHFGWVDHKLALQNPGINPDLHPIWMCIVPACVSVISTARCTLTPVVMHWLNFPCTESVAIPRRQTKLTCPGIEEVSFELRLFIHFWGGVLSMSSVLVCLPPRSKRERIDNSLEH